MKEQALKPLPSIALDLLQGIIYQTHEMVVVVGSDVVPFRFYL